jgi:aconitate hydratase
MSSKRPILKALGILLVFILVVFTGTFFYAYLTGGEQRALALLAGDGIGILQIEGTIDDSNEILREFKRFQESPWIKAVVVRIDTPGEADYYRHGGILQYVLRSLLV